MAKTGLRKPSMDTGKKINLSELNDHDKQLIQKQLEKILESSYFNSAKQMKRFLDYIVKKALQGEGAFLKQYTIGVEALGHADDFDSESNPSVRIMGGRVRKRLKEYYSDSNTKQNNTILVTIPKGTYAPEFRYFESKETSVQPSFLNTSDSTSPSIAIISYTNVNQDKFSNRILLQTVDLLAEKCSQLLLCKFSLYNPFADKNDSLNHRSDMDEDYALSISLQELADNKYEFICRFSETDSKQILWSANYKLDNQKIDFSQDQLIRKIIADVLDIHQGRLQLHWARLLLLNKSVIPDQFKVLVFFRQYYDNFSSETFAEAVSACELALSKNPNDIIANVVFADLCRRDYVYCFNQIEFALDKGIKSAEKVSHLRPDSGDGHFVLGQLLFSKGEWERCKNEFFKTRELTSYNSALQYAIGQYYCMMGEWDKGLELVKKCINTSYSYPTWYHTPIALNYYNQEKYEKALLEANKIFAPNIPLGPLLRSICFAQLDKVSEAKKEYKDLIERLPCIGTNARDAVLRLFGNEALCDKVCAGLKKIT